MWTSLPASPKLTPSWRSTGTPSAKLLWPNNRPPVPAPDSAAVPPDVASGTTRCLRRAILGLVEASPENGAPCGSLYRLGSVVPRTRVQLPPRPPIYDGMVQRFIVSRKGRQHGGLLNSQTQADYCSRHQFESDSVRVSPPVRVRRGGGVTATVFRGSVMATGTNLRVPRRRQPPARQRHSRDERPAGANPATRRPASYKRQ